MLIVPYHTNINYLYNKWVMIPSYGLLVVDKRW
jgi:hypothetical protein